MHPTATLQRRRSLYTPRPWVLLAVWISSLAFLALYVTVHDDPWQWHGRHEFPSSGMVLASTFLAAAIPFVAVARTSTRNLGRRQA